MNDADNDEESSEEVSDVYVLQKWKMRDEDALIELQKRFHRNHAAFAACLSLQLAKLPKVTNLSEVFNESSRRMTNQPQVLQQKLLLIFTFYKLLLCI